MLRAIACFLVLLAGALPAESPEPPPNPIPAPTRVAPPPTEDEALLASHAYWTKPQTGRDTEKMVDTLAINWGRDIFVIIEEHGALSLEKPLPRHPYAPAADGLLYYPYRDCLPPHLQAAYQPLRLREIYTDNHIEFAMSTYKGPLDRARLVRDLRDQLNWHRKYREWGPGWTGR